MERPYTAFQRVGGDDGPFEYIGESEYSDALMAVLDVSYRESGSVPAEGNEYGLLSEDGKTFDLIRVTASPSSVAI